MEYNTGRDQLIIPEYGRHVQKMVKHATGIKDKQKRKECVEAIIAFMGAAGIEPLMIYYLSDFGERM